MQVLTTIPEAGSGFGLFKESVIGFADRTQVSVISGDRVLGACCNMSIQSFYSPLSFSIAVLGEVGIHFRWDTMYTHIHNFILVHILACFLGYGRKLDKIDETHKNTGLECKTHTYIQPSLMLNPGARTCKATTLAGGGMSLHHNQSF